jgi:hypothetical protein
MVEVLNFGATGPNQYPSLSAQTSEVLFDVLLEHRNYALIYRCYCD